MEAEDKSNSHIHPREKNLFHTKADFLGSQAVRTGNDKDSDSVIDLLGHHLVTAARVICRAAQIPFMLSTM